MVCVPGAAASRRPSGSTDLGRRWSFFLAGIARRSSRSASGAPPPPLPLSSTSPLPRRRATL
eukprot:4780519-Prymnesium_polylepis.1